MLLVIDVVGSLNHGKLDTILHYYIKARTFFSAMIDS